MNLEDFWKIIEVGKKSDEPEIILEAELKTKSAVELEEFQKHFYQLFDSAYKWDLWGAAYIISGGCSDDGFIDFRYGLISKGQEVFEKAILDPDSLSKFESESIENESFGYVAGEAYENLTGKEIEVTENSDEEESMGEEWDFDDESENLKRLPKLMKKYW
jgi:hypothetical protein